MVGRERVELSSDAYKASALSAELTAYLQLSKTIITHFLTCCQEEIFDLGRNEGIEPSSSEPQSKILAVKLIPPYGAGRGTRTLTPCGSRFSYHSISLWPFNKRCGLDYVFAISSDLGSWYIVSTHLGQYCPLSSALSLREFRRISTHPIRSFLSYGSIRNTNVLIHILKLIHELLYNCLQQELILAVLRLGAYLNSFSKLTQNLRLK